MRPRAAANVAEAGFLRSDLSLHYRAPAEFYLGRGWETTAALGPRAFRVAPHALRFALVEAAPVSLHGARLRDGDRVFAGRFLAWLYLGRDNPLA